MHSALRNKELNTYMKEGEREVGRGTKKEREKEEGGGCTHTE